VTWGAEGPTLAVQVPAPSGISWMLTRKLALASPARVGRDATQLLTARTMAARRSLRTELLGFRYATVNMMQPGKRAA
jgi:hypothetical protein